MKVYIAGQQPFEFKEIEIQYDEAGGSTDIIAEILGGCLSISLTDKEMARLHFEYHNWINKY